MTLQATFMQSDQGPACIRRSWALLGCSWGSLGPILGALGAVLGSSWAGRGPISCPLGLSWRLLGPILSLLGSCGLVLWAWIPSHSHARHQPLTWPGGMREALNPATPRSAVIRCLQGPRLIYYSRLFTVSRASAHSAGPGQVTRSPPPLDVQDGPQTGPRRLHDDFKTR